jgi:hypothetical protein
MKGCLVTNFHKILEPKNNTNIAKWHRIQKEKGDWKKYDTM